MQTTEFIQTVRERADYADDDQARGAAQATLTTLGQMKLKGEIDDTADQLPREMAELLFNADAEPEKYSAAQFVERVRAALELNSTEDAANAVRAVLSTLADALTPGQMGDLMGQLPDQYAAFMRNKTPEL